MFFFQQTAEGKKDNRKLQWKTTTKKILEIMKCQLATIEWDREKNFKIKNNNNNKKYANDLNTLFVDVPGSKLFFLLLWFYFQVYFHFYILKNKFISGDG